MKNYIKYILTIILSILAIFYTNNNLNIILVIPLLAFFMFNGLKVFLCGLIGTLLGSIINILISNNYVSFTYLLINLVLYFVIYFINLIFNKKLILNYLISTIVSILSSYLIYLLSNDLFNIISFVLVILLTLIICFMFAFLIKNFSFYLISKLDSLSPLLICSLLVIYLSNITYINNSSFSNNLSLFLILFILLYYSIKNKPIYVMALNSIIILLSLLFDISLIYNNLFILLICSIALAINKSSCKLLNTILVFASLLLNIIIYSNQEPLSYFILSIILSASLLFIEINKVSYEDKTYYKQYVENKNEMMYQLSNFQDMFSSIAINFKNARTSKILNYLKEDVFDIFCANCEECIHCYKKGKHILINYLKDYLLDQLNEDKIRYVIQNCSKSKAYFVLLDSFCKTYLIKEYEKQEDIKFKNIIAIDFASFSNVMSKVYNTIEHDRLYLSSNFFKNIKAALNEYTFDILFINDNSTDCHYNFDIAIKDINKGEINDVLLPIISNTLQTNMKVDKIDHTTLTSNYYVITISEQKPLQIDYAIKQSNEDIKANGDSYFTLFEKSIFYLAISDGMGCGINANEESKFTLDTLISMLKAKIDIIESIYLSNNILQLKNIIESYATLDLCAIDTNKSIVSFFKLGAFTTFIIRDHIVTEVSNYSLPLGIIEHINVMPSSYKIKEGDIIVMCSDGMIDDSNLNVISILEDLSIDDASTICNLLFSKLIKIRENGDDATLAIITIK